MDVLERRGLGSRHLVPFLFLLIIWTVSTVQGNPNRIKEQEILQQILDENKYDKRIRAYGEAELDPTTVSINMYVRHIERLDDVKMTFNVQLTFRMQWLDTRLNYEALQSEGVPYLSLVGSSSKRIWTPDLFFSNEKAAVVHDMLMPNAYTRIFPDGNVLVSQRISLTLFCPMVLSDFPFDKQVCSIRMASYGWTTADLIFKWKYVDPIQVTQMLHLPQFSLQEFTTDYCDSHTNTGIYSCIRTDFTFIRELSYYLVKVYVPTSMMVILAWLSLWMDYRDAGARVVVSVLTLLVCAVMVTMFNENFPRVSYTKAIDVWTGFCLTFLFSAVLEFVIVNWLDRSEERPRKAPINLDGLPEEVVGATRKLTQSERFKELPLPGKIDYVWRFLYPGLFILFNIIYWAVYSG